MTWTVEWDKKVEKQLKNIPDYIEDAFHEWVLSVETIGMEATRKLTGYNDEQLKPPYKKGERSVRLNKAYRAIYREKKNGKIQIASVFEVNKHDYKRR
ncbi:MAG: type II toxin-antitoxin system RelE/ParE family toxin [Bdellovibrionota bacterium]